MEPSLVISLKNEAMSDTAFVEKVLDFESRYSVILEKP